ncbi:MAG TPA: polymer-forming cytoskeletal protein [Candidatus Saccharimonadales bacterium]|nr:polymer-forming cytoskeletal protein [Candidatus Saccharimonadales bacterium]
MDAFGSNPQDNQDSSELESLEGPSTVVEQNSAATPSSGSSDPVAAAPGEAGSGLPTPGSSGKPPHQSRLKNLLHRFNIYMIVFVISVLAAAAIVIVAVLHNRNNKTLTTQTLSQSTLDQLANSDVTVGDAKQILNVQSNAIFAGTVLVRSDLQVAGKLQVGSSLSLAGLTVSGTSVFDQVQINKDLTVVGNQSVQGNLTAQKNLTVNGTGTFKGAVSAPQLTVGTLQLNGDLTLTHHVIPGGPNPSRSYGTALGSGGSASVSGSDTSGSITISTGSGPGTGCFVTVKFTQAFTATPHVIITPVGSAAAGLHYYINRSTTSFSVCTTSAAPASSTFGFDYWAAD